jgi:PEP-CTERM motif
MLPLIQHLVRRWVICVGLGTALFVPAFALADPVRITGSVTIFPDGSELSLQGPDFSLFTLNLGNSREAPIRVVPVGRSVAFEFDDSPSGAGKATVPGFKSDPRKPWDVFIVGRFHYSTPSMFLPDPMSPNAHFSFPFTMTGTISVSDAFSSAPPFFTVSVFGSGSTGVSDLFRDETFGPVYVNGGNFQTFDFTDPGPVPEPGTLLLCGSALVALCARHRRRQPAR